MAHGTPGLVIGLVGGGALAYLGMYVKFAIRPRSTTSGAAVGLISLTEDLVAFATAVLVGLLAPIGYVFFAWTLCFCAPAPAQRGTGPARCARRRGRARSGGLRRQARRPRLRMVEDRSCAAASPTPT
jgi:hypothetical protein